MTYEHWLFIFFVIFLLLDVIAYILVLRPVNNNVYKLPGGGFVAYWKYRRDKLAAKNAEENVDENS